LTGNATNCETHIRVELVMAAKRHGMPTVAVVVATPLSVCLERQGPRPDNRRVPEDVVRAQHKAMTYSHQQLAAEGFNTVVFADTLYRLEPFLNQVSDIRVRELGQGGDDGLGDLMLPRWFFGPELLPLWRWKDGSTLAGGDRVAEIRIDLILALRRNIDGEGSIGFEVLLPCPFDDECEGTAWAPAYTVTDLWGALTGDRDQDPDIVCTAHGSFDDVDQEADDHALEALRETVGSSR
jgi:hypothetical protein